MRLIVGVSILLMSLVALAGPAPSKDHNIPTRSCAAAIGKGIDRLTDAKRKDAPAEQKAMIDDVAAKLKIAITNRCTKDSWPAEVVDCYAAAQKRDDLHVCGAKLPPDLAAKLQKDELDLLTGLRGGVATEAKCSDTEPPRVGTPAEGEVYQCYEAIKKQALDFQTPTNPSCKECVDAHADALAKDQAAVASCFRAAQSRPYAFTAFDPDEACSAFEKDAARRAECLDHAKAAKQANLLARRTNAATTSAAVLRAVPPNDRTPEEAARISSELAACRQAGNDVKLDELSKIKDEVCACKDSACADSGHDKYVAWKKRNTKNDKPDEEQMKQFQDLREQLLACRHDISDHPAPPATKKLDGTM